MKFSLRRALRPVIWGLLAIFVPAFAGTAEAAPNSLPFILHSFDGSVNGGANPDSGPLLYVPTLGMIFGTTTGIGAPSPSATGTIFSLDPIANGTVTTLQTVHAVPNNGLALGYDSSSNMVLYGTDVALGSTFGEIFRVNPTSNGTEATVRDFNDGTSPYPTYPQSGLVAAPDGYLYGTTRYVSGTSNQTSHSGVGVLYRFLPSAPSATFEILHGFASDGSEGHPMKGALPLVTSSGVIYGVNTTSFVAYGTSGQGAMTPASATYTNTTRAFPIAHSGSRSSSNSIRRSSGISLFRRRALCRAAMECFTARPIGAARTATGPCSASIRRTAA